MVTRRTLLKQGVSAALSAATVPLLVLSARAQSSAPATFDYYISPTGSDSNAGTTMSEPWSINAINTKRTEYAGKRVGLLNGTYNVYSLCQAGTWSRPGLSVNGGPNAGSPTIIAAVNPRQAILTGANPANGAYPTNGCGVIGQGFEEAANIGNVILDGLYVTRSYQYGIVFYPARSANPEGGATGIIVRNCEIFDIGGSVNNNVGGVMTFYCTGALVSNNRIHSVQPDPLGGNSADVAGIFSFDSHSNIYEYNTIYDCNVGIYDKNWHNGNHTYRYNYIEVAGLYPITALRDCAGGDAGDTVTVHNNILVGPSIWDGSDAMNLPSLQSLVFYNNTCYYGSGDSGIFYPAAGSRTSPPATVTFYNNIIFCSGTTGYAGLVEFCSGTLVLVNYNVYHAAANKGGILALSELSAPRAPKLYTLTGWREATGLDQDSVAPSVTSNALFGGVASLSPTGYQLQPSALARNMGRVGGNASGATTDAGAWGGGATQIGCNFGPVPRSPVLTIN